MKKNVNDSIERMKLLMEFQYKTNKLDSIEENPVKFNEIGDKYKSKPESDYPAFSEYLDEVIMDEDDEQPDDGNQQPQQPAPAPEAQLPQPDAQAMPPAPAPQPEQQPLPAQEVLMQQTAPVPQATDLGSTAPSELDMKLADQIAKTDELLSKINDIDLKLATVGDVSTQLHHVAQEVESIKNPSLDDQLEMISKQSYPYNIKLNDYWKWDEDDEKDNEPEEFSVSPDELNSFNKDDIKQSFNENIEHIK